MVMHLNGTRPDELARQGISRVETCLIAAPDSGLTLADLMDAEGHADFPEDATSLAVMHLRAIGSVSLVDDRLTWVGGNLERKAHHWTTGRRQLAAIPNTPGSIEIAPTLTR